MAVTLWGVRGSTPSPTPANMRYGGNTPCMTIDAPGLDQPLVFDAGTGLRELGQTYESAFQGHFFLTHLHLDHIQGLPFFTPIYWPGADVTFVGPDPGNMSLGDAIHTIFSPPFFPICLSDLVGDYQFHQVDDETFTFADLTVRGALVPHCGPTLGYRISRGDTVVAFVPDHQQPEMGFGVDDNVAELIAGADLAILDAQYTPDEFDKRRDWGHSTVEYAVQVAADAGVKRLALFSHDPSHDDADIDRLVDAARDLPGGDQVEIFAAVEHETLHLG